MLKSDLYNILGLDKDATQEQIKEAYKRKSQVYHPDKGGDNDDFVKLSTAYAILGNVHKREEYDRTGNADTRSEDEIIRTRSIDILCQMLNSMIDNPNVNIFQVDVIDELHKTLRKNIADFNKRLADLKAAIDKHQRIKKRLKYKGKGNDFFTHLIDDRIKNMNRMIDVANLDIKTAETANAIISDYSFEYDPQTCTVRFNVDAGSTSSTTAW